MTKLKMITPTLAMGSDTVTVELTGLKQEPYATKAKKSQPMPVFIVAITHRNGHVATEAHGLN